MPAKRLGLFLVVCAPSGTGKSTLVKRLCAEFPNLSFSVSATTRPPRHGETDGVDYHFLDRDTFLAWREAGRLAEWAEVHGNFYGTPLEPVRQAMEAGYDILFDIDVQAKVAADAAGAELRRTQSLNTTPTFISALEALVREKL